MVIMEENLSKKRDYLLPGSILIAAVMISVSLIYNVGQNATSDGSNQRSGTGTGSELSANLGESTQAKSIRKVGADDHIRGSANAPVTIIEYSDLECPWCKVFHETLQQAMDDYQGQIKWVYRHFPITQLHSKAPQEAQAAECAASIGGNEKFWAFIDRVFEVTPSNNGLDLSTLPSIAEDVGLSSETFKACLDKNNFESVVQADYEDAIVAGGRGTPHSVVISRSGKHYVIPGAIPYTSSDPTQPSVKSVIEQALAD